MNINKKDVIKEEIYRELVNKVSIDAIKLDSLSITDVNHYNSNNIPQLGVNLKFENEEFKVNGSELRVLPNFFVEVVDESSENKEIAFKINLTFLIEYSIEGLDKFDNGYVEMFVLRNVPINIWPYAREFISSLTTRIGYPALVIGAYKG